MFSRAHQWIVGGARLTDLIILIIGNDERLHGTAALTTSYQQRIPRAGAHRRGASISLVLPRNGRTIPTLPTSRETALAQNLRWLTRSWHRGFGSTNDGMLVKTLPDGSLNRVKGYTIGSWTPNGWGWERNVPSN